MEPSVMKISLPARFLRAHRGNVVIEMAAIAPVLIFMALGAFDFGMAYSVTTSYVAAIRAGYEYAFTSSDTNAITARVNANLDSSTLDATYPKVSLVCECQNAPGASVSCTSTCGGTVTTPYQYVDIQLKGKYPTLFSWPFLSIDGATQKKYIAITEGGRVQVK
jgi:Flp pilus assembly protein TadG